MANTATKTRCQNRFKDTGNIKESFNRLWIVLINRFERDGVSDLKTVRDDV